ncbi:O-linked N-acetylglucosamine transferase, SPINDLY family protein [Leisingera caerulea]|uniref:O-linked N-acetylglucosamine transferase, SPINDLY family protein n=1 Tax=Leisingera caerulea TaxID=506591 RepID=UPI0021A4FE46|nr:tetratricopeptide repeat protein [Leisingera caerulea]UWQ85180.1 tetratricopeptide repeat protein [Leisingera caerulea]
MANSQAQHFLASSGPENPDRTKQEFAGAVSSNGRADFAMAMRHGMIKQSNGTPQEQAVALHAKARKLALKRQFSDAEYLLRQALKLDDKNRMIYASLGEVLEMMNRPEKAILAHIDALRLDPSNSKCLSYIGTYLMRLNQDEEAINYFDAAVKFDPNNATALARLVYLRRRICDWTDLGNREKRVQVFRKTDVGIDPFAFLSMVDDPGLQMKFSVKAAELAKVDTSGIEFERPRAEGRKIRLGYFSNDFFDHATMYLIGRQLELHDRDRFEIYIYDYGEVNNHEGRLRAENAADVYKQVASLENDEIAAVAREDGLDIAIDLKGYTKGNRVNIFNNRLAPVHVTYLGYPGTTGVDQMDYMIADPVTIPGKLRKFYTEKILYMPDCYQPNDDQRAAADTVPSRAEAGLPEDAFVFCSFNSPYKVSPDEFDVWMKLLDRVPDSVLWFYAPRDKTCDYILKEAKKRGIGPERIVFAGFAGQKEHLARLQLADVFLDTFAVNAHTTASDALWAGVPVVTKTGKQFAARVATSLVHCAGVPELAAATPQQYQALALKLARDPEYLAAIKARIKEGIAQGPLYDTEKFTRNFEALMEKAVQRYNAGLKPDHLSLA